MGADSVVALKKRPSARLGRSGDDDDHFQAANRPGKDDEPSPLCPPSEAGEDPISTASLYSYLSSRLALKQQNPLLCLYQFFT